MFFIRLLLPLVYGIFGIILPIYCWKLSYAASVLVFFYLPSLILLAYNWRWLRKHMLGWPFIWVNIIAGTICFFFEYLSLGLNLWGFGKHVVYLGIRIWDTPFEEFLFYWGATPFSILVYIYYYRIIKERVNVHSLPILSAWFIIGIPFTLLTLKIYRLIKNKKVLSLPSLIFTIAIFFLCMTFFEHFAVVNQYWVYNYSRLFGPKIWEIPIEEFLLYYWLGAVFVVLLFHLLTFRPVVELRQSREELLNNKQT